MLPEGWKRKSVDDIFDVQLGKMLNKEAKEKYPQYNYLGNSNVLWGSFSLNNLNKMYFSEKERIKFHLKRDDILMCEGGEVGRCAIWKMEDANVFFQKAIHRLRSKGSVCPTFFQNFMQSISGTKLLEDYTTKTSIAHLTREKLLAIPVLLPPLPEQEKIAAILSTWDRAIEGTEKLLANSQQQKKALMQQLLTGKKRLPGFTGEWKKHRLSDFFVRLMQRNTSGNTNVVTISAQDGLVKQEEYFKKTVASETLDGYFLLENGDFAYNKSYSIGYPMGAIKRLNRYEKGVVTTLYICFRLKSHQFANGDFFEFYFNSGLMNYGLTQIAHEGGRAHGLLNVKPADFMHLQVTVPSVDEQQAIAAVLSTADKEITALESDLSRLRQEKKALMQQLLTGKRRVTVN